MGSRTTCVNQAPKPSPSHLPGLLLCALAVVCGLTIIYALLRPWLATRGDRVPQVQADISGIQVALGAYKAHFGHYPTGASSSVMRALTGDNPAKQVFIELGPRRTSWQGDLLDPWGTPYKIYSSGDEFLIRSAGKNKVFESTRDKGCDDVFGG